MIFSILIRYFYAAKKGYKISNNIIKHRNSVGSIAIQIIAFSFTHGCVYVNHTNVERRRRKGKKGRK